MALIVDTTTNARAVYLIDPATGLPISGEAVTIADGADVAEGAMAATAYTDATGAAAGTLVGLNKGQYALTAAMSAKLPASLGIKTAAASLSVAPASDATFVTIGNVASGAADSLAPVKVGGKYNSANITLTDGQRGDLQVDAGGNLRTRLVGANLGSGSDGVSQLAGVLHIGDNITSAQTRLLPTAPSVFSGSSWDRQRGDVNGTVMQSGLSSTFWGYAAASGGITNTTAAVTLKAAGAASVRNYLKTLQISATALGVGTEIAIRDGAGGTVLWRGQIGTAGISNDNIVFDPPLKGTAATLMEFVTLTATVTGAVYVNAQGFTGA